jgi:hypothetical protein
LKRSREASVHYTSLLPPFPLLRLASVPILVNFINISCVHLTSARFPEPPPLTNPSSASSSHAPGTLRSCVPPRVPWRPPLLPADPPHLTRRSRDSASRRSRGTPDLTPPPPMAPRPPPPSRPWSTSCSRSTVRRLGSSPSTPSPSSPTSPLSPARTFRQPSPSPPSSAPTYSR